MKFKDKEPCKPYAAKGGVGSFGATWGSDGSVSPSAATRRHVRRSSSEDSKIAESRIANNKTLAATELSHVTLHGLRRSFGTLSEWVEVPVGVIAQIQGISRRQSPRSTMGAGRSIYCANGTTASKRWMLEQAGIPQCRPRLASSRLARRASFELRRCPRFPIFCR